jgi:ribosomal protein S18 acetylase RimI-like enzyme
MLRCAERLYVTGVVVRRGGAQDLRFLRDMLHHAYYWKERRPDAGAGPVQLYVKALGRPGDTVVIALSDGFPVGAAWYRLFNARNPGYGFVDEKTPELAIAVVPNARGKGVGSALLDALLDRAREAGHQSVSLSVDKRNSGAIHVYEEHGFQRVSEDEDSVTMVARLAQPS